MAFSTQFNTPTHFRVAQWVATRYSIPMVRHHYARVAIRSEWCPVCNHSSFVLNGMLQCCGLPCPETPITAEIRWVHLHKRRSHSKWLRACILQAQGGKCFYCFRRIGDYVLCGSGPTLLKPHLDHCDPFCTSEDETDSNLVVACHLCNLLKSATYFDTVVEARNYLREKWNEHGYKTIRVSDLQAHIPSHAKVAKVLQSKVQVDRVGEYASQDHNSRHKRRLWVGDPGVRLCLECHTAFRPTKRNRYFCTATCFDEAWRNGKLMVKPEWMPFVVGHPSANR